MTDPVQSGDAESREYRVGYHPMGAAGPVFTKPLSYEFAVSEYKAMLRQRHWESYYKRIWIESRPMPEPWAEINIRQPSDVCDSNVGSRDGS